MQLSHSSDYATKFFLSWLPLIALCGVIGYYFWFIYVHAINVPFHDDIFDLLQFVIQGTKAESSADWLVQLHEPYNDHRTSATRLVVYIAYLLEGQVNFRTLTLVANLALPLILIPLYLAIRHDPFRWVWLLIAALMLLNLRVFKLVLHAQASFAFLYVYLYAIAGLFALHRVTPARFACAALLCAMSTFTLASGKIVWLLGFISLFQQSYILKQRSYWYLAIWFMIAVALIAVWQLGFRELVYAKNEELLLDERVWRYVSVFLVMLGGAVSDSNTIFAAIVGAIVFVTLLAQSAQSIRKPDIRLLLCCWLALLTAAATTIGRAVIIQPVYILDERYSIHSIILISCLTLLLLSQSKTRRISVICVIVASAGIYCTWSYLQFEGRLLSIMETRYQQFNSHQYLQAYRRPKDSNAVVHEAIREGIYHPPCRPLPACEEGIALDPKPRGE